MILPIEGSLGLILLVLMAGVLSAVMAFYFSLSSQSGILIHPCRMPTAQEAFTLTGVDRKGMQLDST